MTDFNDRARPPYPEDLTDGQVTVLEARMDQLLASTRSRQQGLRAPHAHELEELEGWFRAKGLITEHFVLALVCARFESPGAERLQGHVLRASLHELEEQAKGRRAPKQLRAAIDACSRLRMLSQGKHPALLEFVAETPEGGSEQVVAWMKARVGQLGDKSVRTEEEDRLFNAAGRIKSLLERHVHNVVRTQTREVEPRRHVSPFHLPHDPERESSAPNPEIHDFYDDRSERLDDVESKSSNVDMAPTGPGAHRRSSYVQRSIARSVTDQIIGQQMLSPSAYGTLSPKTLGVLIGELRAGVGRGSPEDALIAASLFSGRSVRDLLLIEMREGRGRRHHKRSGDTLIFETAKSGGDGHGYLSLRSHLALPRPPAPSDMYIAAESVIDVPLPVELLGCLRPCPNECASGESVERRLGELRQTLPQVTAQRVAMTAMRTLYRAGVERTPLHRLYAPNLARATPLYYECMQESNLMRIHERWARGINEHVKDEPFTLSFPIERRRVGSSRCPDLDDLARLISDMRTSVERAVKSVAFKDVHNQMALYTYTALALATGIRAVAQPFESFADFCESTRSFLIDDKHVRSVPSPRIVPLAPFAWRQLQHYRKHLVAATSLLSSTSPALRTYVDDALHGRAPFLFTLSQSRESAEPLRPAMIRWLLGDRFPLVSNWARHLMRTELVAAGVHDEVVQALMGHGEAGQEPYARYSALSVAETARDATAALEALADRIGLTPVSSVRGSLPISFPNWHVPPAQAVQPRREFNAGERAVRGSAMAEKGVEWADERIAEARSDLDRLRDDDYAAEWESRVRERAKDELGDEISWRSARARLAKEIDALNHEQHLRIPAAAPPVRLRHAPTMRNQKMFAAQRAVQAAALKFDRALQGAGPKFSVDDDDLPYLILFSAACFGGLSQTEALEQLEKSLRREEVVLRRSAEHGLCWMDLCYETNSRNNVLVDDKPLCVRRFFPDGTTLALLVRHLRRRVGQPPSERDAVSKRAFERRLFKAINKFCGDKVLPESLSLGQFARGAVTVAERQPGVSLPNHLAEYACGVIDSVSLPDPYFRHCLGSRVPQQKRVAQPSSEPEPPPLAGCGPEPTAGEDIGRVAELFKDLPDPASRAAKEELLRRLEAQLARPPSSELLKLLLNWLWHLLVERRLRVSSVIRYSRWTAKQFLFQFDGVNLAGLDAEGWREGYEELLERVRPLGEQPKVAGRLDDLHRYLSETAEFPRLPSSLTSEHKGKSVVRPRVIPERTFQAFKRALRRAPLDNNYRERAYWIFVLLYRLGTRIGETSRILLAHLEIAPDPLLTLRASERGNTKTGRPRQIRIKAFLTKREWEEFETWVKKRRARAKSPREPLFAPPEASFAVYKTHQLGRLFTELMKQVSGLHFSPHDCRHTAASRLIWVCEGEKSPDSDALNGLDEDWLKTHVFTRNRSGRDRIWHLCSAFGHLSPETTLGDYVHFLDLLLHKALARSERALPARAVSAIAGCPVRRLVSGRNRKESEIPIEGVASILQELNPDLFEVVAVDDPEYGSSPTKESNSEVAGVGGRKSEPGLLVYQLALQSIDEGKDLKLVALNFDLDVEQIQRLVRSAERVRDTRTRSGVSRTISKKRRALGRNPLAPTRRLSEADQLLVDKLVPKLRNLRKDADGKELLLFACRHWLQHTTTSNSGLVFHSPDDLRKFLDCFARRGGIPSAIWLVRVRRPAGPPDEALLKPWRVLPGATVQFGKKTVKNAEKHPQGTAVLHLLRQTKKKRKGASKESGELLNYLLHMLCIVLEIHA